MVYDLIMGLGALILAFLMGGVAGVVLTITILVRHTEREASKAKVRRNPSATDLVRDLNRAAVSDFLDLPLAGFRPGRKVKR